ncbi:MAG: 4-hydroxybenzoate polyprenyltransferase-like prenyltransferase [Frankiales bacterium]|nr:4-hydroxybenzoate polyprenyltransferase-like prenyltransferase [Frankiales bacterium]
MHEASTARGPERFHGRVRAMSTLSRLVRACHPEPTVAVSGLVAALAGSVGASAWRVGLAFLSGQLSVGWSNDWFDAERDRAVGRADKPVVQGLPRSTVRSAALLAAAACVPLSLLMGTWAGLVHLLAVASAWSYNSRLKATALSFAPYLLSFALVPSIVTLGLPGHPWAPWWATGAGALLGVGAHGANVLPDLEDDEATGVRGAFHRLGRRWASAVSGLALVVATVLLAAGPGISGYGIAGIAVSVAVFGAGLVLGQRPGSRAPFLSVLVVAAVDIGLLLAGGASLA